MELTIDELAQKVGMTGRNIRQWQTNGLLPPPIRRGRVGVYTDHHLSTINRIKELREQGFPLDLIRRVFDNPTRQDEQHVRHFTASALLPFDQSDKETADQAEFDLKYGSGVSDLLVSTGLASLESRALTVDVAIVSLLTQARDVGIDPIALVRTIGRAQPHVSAISEDMVDQFLETVWRPFVADGMSAPGWHDLASHVDGMRELAVNAQAVVFRRALDAAAATAIVREGRALNAHLGAPRAHPES